MNQTPHDPKKKAQTPPAQPQWNPYYRRNPDGTPGGHDRTIRENITRNDTAAQQTQSRQAAAHTAAQAQSAPAQNPQGLGQPIRRASAPRVTPAGRNEPMPQKKQAPKPQTDANTGGVRYRRNPDGTMSRVYPPKTRRSNAKAKRMLLIAAAALIVVAALIIGVIALVRGISPKIEYSYDYNNGQYTAVAPQEEAMPEEVPYLNMNYLAAIYSMTVSGSYDDMKFSTAAGEYVSFMPNSRVTMVNGNRHVMSEPALLRGQEMWIPSDFVESMFDGIAVKWDHEEHKVTVTPAADGETVTPLTFRLRPADGGTQSGAVNWEEGYTYLTDMTAFKDAIEPANRDGFLMLVNKENALSSTYTPADLVEVTNMKAGYENKQYMCETAELALQALYQDLYAAGYTDVGVTSGYRTYKTQELLHERYVLEEMDKRNVSRTEADAYASRYSAVAGQSEHQTGLAADMYNTASADASFGETEAYKWLRDHAHQYGFILRYPEDKTDITGYDFEPWHYRYVGRYHATQMYEQGLCLEEYLRKLN